MFGMAHLGNGHEGLDIEKRWAKKRNMNRFRLVKGKVCNT